MRTLKGDLGRVVYNWLWCSCKLAPANTFQQGEPSLGFPPLHGVSTLPVFPSFPVMAACAETHDFCIELFWVPDLGHKARVRNVGAVWRYDVCLWFIVLESRGIWLKPVSLGCSSCRKNGLGVTRLAAACLCFSTYQKLLGGLSERWKIS